VSSRPSNSDAMDQLKTLGSLIGVCNAPCKDEIKPDPEEADQGPRRPVPLPPGPG